VKVRSDAAYLITGGLGALGLVTARWLASQGARHLALVGRSAPGAEAQAALGELQQQGVQVLVAAADLSQADEVARLLAQTARELPPLAGIVHAAGVLDDGVLAQQTPARFEKVLAPKAAGGWHLHEQTRALPLDFFVMYSSMASLLGSPGQGNYAAANAFLDGLAWRRRALGLPATSVNWGPWAEVGMAATRSAADQRRWQAQGLSPIPTAAGLKYLEQFLHAAPTQVAVLPIDWAQWRKSYPKFAELPLFSQLIDAGGGRMEASPDRDALLAVPPAERRGKLQEYLRDQVARILQISADKLDPHQPLKTVGLDSLMAIELKNLVETSLAVEIPAVKLLEGPTLAQLAAELAPQLGAAAEEATAAAPSGTGSIDVQGSTDKASWIAYHEPRPQARLRLLCFHYLGGGASAFRQWADGLPPEIDVLPVQLPGREGRIHEPPCEDLLALAEKLVDELSPHLDRPLAIYGHSMGSLIGFELARQLRRRLGVEPVHLFVGGYFAPHTPNPFHTRKDWHEAEVMQTVQRLLDVPEAVLANPEFMQALLPTMQADSRLVGSYTWREETPLACPITAFGGLEDREVGRPDLEQWRRHTTGAFRLEMLPGGHLFLLSERARLLKIIAEELASVVSG
jgi:surfactin synthase thioesterase subunit/NAD(P)-dependent dehydrogenase (short-subunit alcohol dehydrogenase family)/aryl carrier-like protein